MLPPTHSFLYNMASGSVFIASGVVASAADGIGEALAETTAMALIAYLYPRHVGFLTVILPYSRASDWEPLRE